MNNYQNKKISILGAERSGIAAAKLCKKVGAFPFVSDSGSAEKLSKRSEELNSAKINHEFGKHSNKVFDCDLIVISPGVPSNSEVVQEANTRGIEVISEIEFASKFCKATVIGITGTNGKSTTTKLCEHTLKTAGLNCVAAGNIGLPFSDVVLDLNEHDFVSLEISSFQLDHIKEFKPQVGILLNITPDHLDRYNNDFNGYAAAKMRITKNQDYSDYFIYNSDDKVINTLVGSVRAVKVRFGLNEKLHEGCYILNNWFTFETGKKDQQIMSTRKFALKGKHNHLNGMAVIAAAKLIGIKNNLIKKAFETFPGVEHRLELVRELNGVTFINDSKATNVDSVWYALQSFNQPLHLILGGIDKGNEYSRIEEFVNQYVRKIYAIGDSAEKINSFFSGKVEIEKFDSLDSSVKKAYSEAKKNETVLLSPACASFDMFKNFEERGRIFKDIVMSLN